MLTDVQINRLAACLASGMPIEDSAAAAGIIDMQVLFRVLKSQELRDTVQQFQAATDALERWTTCPGEIEAIVNEGEPWPEGERCGLCGGRHIHVLYAGDAVVYMPRKDPYPGLEGEAAEMSRGRKPGIYPAGDGSRAVLVVYEREKT